MASGFLVLPDGRCLSRRGFAHDGVIRAVADQLGPGSVEQNLKKWLAEQLPGPFVSPVGIEPPRTQLVCIR